MVLYNISLEEAANIFKVGNNGYNIQNELVQVKFIQDVEMNKVYEAIFL